MRRVASIAAFLIAAAALFAATAVGGNERTYFVELDSAFGLVDGSEVRVAGVTQGVIDELLINSQKRAVVKVTLNGDLSQLGEDTVCSSEPQSLIAEYFLDCTPKGPPLHEGEGEDEARAESPDIPVEQTRQTVQPDLVQSGLRQPFKERLGILINEFGTALAGNPENLNEAIRRGAPALRQTRQLTKILAEQNEIIRGLNVNSDTIMVELADRREDVRRFVENARATGEASAEVRDELGANFRDLDDFLAELNPTMVELNRLAISQTPLLRDLRAAAPGLTRLSEELPPFNEASTVSVTSLGRAAEVGRRALRKGRDEIRALRRSSRDAPSVADHLTKFLRDLDDPGRAVEEDTRANRDTGRNGETGYTGLEGLLNYVYYQTGALNQFDQVGHLLHFSIFEVEEGPCASYNAMPTVPSKDGGETTDILEAHRCVAWLGPNQPGISENVPIPPYHPSVCPDGSTDLEICDPDGPETTRTGDEARERAPKAPGREGEEPASGRDPDRPGGESPLPGDLDDTLDLPGLGDRLLDGADDLGKALGLRRGERGLELPGGDRLGLRRDGRRGIRQPAPGGAETAGVTRDLLGFLLDD